MLWRWSSSFPAITPARLSRSTGKSSGWSRAQKAQQRIEAVEARQKAEETHKAVF